MQFTVLTFTLLSSLVSARDFTFWNDAYLQGATHRETRWDDGVCWNLNGKGDQASSVAGNGCTTFYRERDCNGASWNNWGRADTVPDFLNDHIWSFRNGDYCCDSDGRAKCLVACQIGCAAAVLKPCIEQCRGQCKELYHCISG